MREKELKYCTVSIKDHIKIGEKAQSKLNILSSADTSLKMFLHEMKTSMGVFDQTMGSHLDPTVLQEKVKFERPKVDLYRSVENMLADELALTG